MKTDHKLIRTEGKLEKKLSWREKWRKKNMKKSHQLNPFKDQSFVWVSTLCFLLSLKKETKHIYKINNMKYGKCAKDHTILYIVHMQYHKTYAVFNHNNINRSKGKRNSHSVHYIRVSQLKHGFQPTVIYSKRKRFKFLSKK